MKMKAKIKITNNKDQEIKNTDQARRLLVKQLGRDARDSALAVSVIVSAYLLVGWVVIQTTSRYDASIINYLQNN